LFREKLSMRVLPPHVYEPAAKVSVAPSAARPRAEFTCEGDVPAVHFHSVLEPEHAASAAAGRQSSTAAITKCFIRE
jgi:hypothetical protein